jgi:hypothetical protein
MIRGGISNNLQYVQNISLGGNTPSKSTKQFITQLDKL